MDPRPRPPRRKDRQTDPQLKADHWDRRRVGAMDGHAVPRGRQYTFPAGLAPVDIDHGRDLGSDREPNVGIVHPLCA